MLAFDLRVNHILVQVLLAGYASESRVQKHVLSLTELNRQSVSYFALDISA